MQTSEFDPRIRARDVRISEETLTVLLADGRIISVPIEWYPRLHRATPAQRANWRLIGDGDGIRWPDVDEDISTIGLLEGCPSVEYRRATKG
jgi:hypothetical protein